MSLVSGSTNLSQNKLIFIDFLDLPLAVMTSFLNNYGLMTWTAQIPHEIAAFFCNAVVIEGHVNWHQCLKFFEQN